MTARSTSRRLAKMRAEDLLYRVEHYFELSERNMARFHIHVDRAAQESNSHHATLLRKMAGDSLMTAVDLWEQAKAFLVALEAAGGKASPEMSLALHHGIGPGEITPSLLDWALRRNEAARRSARTERRSERVPRRSYAEREARRIQRAERRKERASVTIAAG